MRAWARITHETNGTPAVRGAPRMIRTSGPQSSWRLLPVPDAALGAAGYAFELCLALTLLRRRPGGRLNAWARVAYGAAAVGMALAGAFLVGVQALSLHAFCTLCLLSAALSWALMAVALPTLGDGARTLLASADNRRSA
jgi:uncharacterized membrane protein